MAKPLMNFDDDNMKNKLKVYRAMNDLTQEMLAGKNWGNPTNNNSH